MNWGEYESMCFKCGVKKYPEKKKHALEGIGVAMGKCPVCKKENVGIIPGRDWAYRAGEFEKVI
jgi:Zn finger protein HypA/HybF involved in hydrogenase expression